MATDDLRDRLAAARARADEAEAARIEANRVARDAATEAAALERALDAIILADHVAEHGEPTQAAVNLAASTHAEIRAAIATGAMTSQVVRP